MKQSSVGDIIAKAAHSLARLGVKSSSSLLAAISGGADSMTLAYILNELRKKGHLKKLTLIHINHSLRGKEADEDEALVKQFAKKLKIPFFSFKVDTRKHAIANRIGIEEAARHLRYEKIGEVAAKNKFQFVATAHTANDQAETVLMNIVRGAGINGLQGIPETRKLSANGISPIGLIRPILGIGKKDILAFADENKIAFREDESNVSLDFQRNRVRHLVLPKLERAFKDRDIYSGFSKMTRNIASIAEYIDGEVAELRKKNLAAQPSFFIHRKITSFDKTGLLKAPKFLRRELIVQEASSLSGKLVSIDNIHSLLMESYLTYKSSKIYKPFSLIEGIILSHDGKYITIEKIDIPPTDDHILVIGKKLETVTGAISAKKVKGWRKPIDANSAYFNYREFNKRKLFIRYWKPGDKMKPFGMKGKSRLVSDILNESGIKSERLKYFVPLVVFQDEPDFILWIPGIRAAEFARLTSKSETALELRRIIS